MARLLSIAAHLVAPPEEDEAAPVVPIGTQKDEAVEEGMRVDSVKLPRGESLGESCRIDRRSQQVRRRHRNLQGKRSNHFRRHPPIPHKEELVKPRDQPHQPQCREHARPKRPLRI